MATKLAVNVHDDSCISCKKPVDPSKQRQAFIHDHCEPIQFWPKWRREQVFVDREKVLANRAKKLASAEASR
jgi:hypothetical protein